jgi:hypothetical protein
MHWLPQHSFHSQVCTGYPSTPSTLRYALASPALPPLSGMHWLPQHSIHFSLRYALATPALRPLSGMHWLPKHSFHSPHFQV